ncbi:hypothetical protein EOL70_16795 [Leucothrix sargassi]|nr:hypothetical protein EOL70_16795 [Leucothrix sargassi]
MNITFVSSHAKPELFLDDASFRYRCENLAEALEKIGASCDLTHLTSFIPSDSLTHVIFHRPIFTVRLKRLTKRLEKMGITYIADFDDLVFDERHADFSPAVLNKRLPRKKLIHRFKKHQQAALLFNFLTVSTTSLAKQARLSFPKKTVTVLKNAMYAQWHANPIAQVTTPRKKVVTYFPGTHSHDRDFLQVVTPLTLFLKKHPDTSLLVIGPLKSRLVNTHNHQIKHIKRLSFTEYAEAIKNSWVNLLPLEPTPFNQCKSAIKVIEAGAYFAPTICSPLPDVLRFEGIGASIAIDDNQWLERLEYLYNDDNYLEVTKKISKHFAKVSSPEQMAIDFCKAFNTL